MCILFTCDPVTQIDKQTEVQCELHVDWLSFSVIDYPFDAENDVIFKQLPFLTYVPGGRHHDHTWTSDCCRVSYIAKKGCKNYDLEIELKGSYFIDYDFDALLTQIGFYGGRIRLFRCDAALDYYGDVLYSKPFVTHTGSFVQYFNYDDQWTGYKYGKSERVVRLYNKLVQTHHTVDKDGTVKKVKKSKQKQITNDKARAAGHWWRYEIAARGDYCRDVFGNEFEFLLKSDIDKKCADLLAHTDNSCYDPIFSSLCKRVSTGDIHTTPKEMPTYDNCEQLLIDNIASRVKKFAHRWNDQCDKILLINKILSRLDYQLEINVPDENDEIDPPSLIGGSRTENQKQETPEPCITTHFSKTCNKTQLLFNFDEKENISEINSKIIQPGKILNGDQDHQIKFSGEKNDYVEMRSVESVEKGV